MSALVVVGTLVGYGIALVDAASWAWIPLLIPVVLAGLNFAIVRFPQWVFLAGTTVVVTALNFNLDAEGGFFILCLAAFSSSATTDRWLPERLLVGVAVLSPVVDAVFGGSAVRDWNWPFWAAGIAVSGYFGLLLFRQQTLTQQLLATQEELANQAAGAERRRIAREVHDLVGHSLTVVLLHITGARRLIQRDPEEAERALADAEHAGRRSLADIRRTVALLRDESEGQQPTPDATDLGSLVEQSRAAGLQIDSRFDDEIDQLDAPTGLAVYRIVQESLANAARHAPDSSVAVQVSVAATLVSVTVDNAPTEGTSRQGGSGITGMRERATTLGGSLRAGPHADGWRVRADLPCRDAAPSWGDTAS